MEEKRSAGPASPLLINTRDLTRRPGSSRTWQATVPAPELMGTDVMSIPTGTDLHLDLLLESVLEGILISGEISGQAKGQCVRCLIDVDADVQVRMQELFVYPERDQAARDAGDMDEDVFVLDGTLADIEPAVRDALIPALPFQPVCQEDCPGLCSECGARLADDPDHHHDQIDPRWSALGSLTFEEEQ